MTQIIKSYSIICLLLICGLLQYHIVQLREAKPMLKLFLFLSLIFLSPSYAFSQSLNEKIELKQKTENELKTLQDEINWFVNFRSEQNKQNLALLQETGDKDRVLENHEKLKASLKDLQLLIEEFHIKLGNVIEYSYEDSQYGQTLKLCALLSSACSFRELIEESLFFENWQSTYDEYCIQLSESKI